MSKKKLSIVIPVFNEQEGLDELWRRVSEVLDTMDLESEVIFVDDGSTDRTSPIIEALCASDPRAKHLRLSRNFGNPCAVAAGIDHAVGDAVVLMDADLQDRPEALPDFIKEWQDGCEVVYAIRESRQESLVMRGAFNLFYWFLAGISGIKQPMNAGNFCLIDRQVVNLLKSMPERNRYFPGLRAYSGFKQKGIEVGRDARFAGKPQMGLLAMFRYAVNAVVSFSYVPIRIVTYTGLIVAFLSLAYIGVILYKKYVIDVAITGWSSTLTAILFLGGIQLVMLGIIGEYIGRIYEEVKQRPYYIVAAKTNLE